MTIERDTLTTGVTPTNPERSDAAGFALETHTSWVGSNDDHHDDLVDLLTNLRHWADTVGVDYDECNRSALRHHTSEADRASLREPVEPINAPVELTVTLRDPRGKKVGETYTLVAYVSPRTGLIEYTLTNDRVTYSLSTLQCRRQFPRKARQGWQADVAAVVRTGIYRIDRIV